jgi:hypothetical protein
MDAIPLFEQYLESVSLEQQPISSGLPGVSVGAEVDVVGRGGEAGVTGDTGLPRPEVIRII